MSESTIRRVYPRMREKQETEPFMAKVTFIQTTFGAIPKRYLRTTNNRVTMSSITSPKALRGEVEALLDLGIDFCKPALSVYVALYEMLFMISQVPDEFAVRSIALWRTT